VKSYWRVCFPPVKKGGKVLVNPKTGKPVTMRVRLGGIVVDDGLRSIRYPLAFGGKVAGTFGELRDKVTHDDLGLPSGIEDGNHGARRMTLEEMRRRVTGLVGPMAADRLMAVCQGVE
jgi:hypothetical protein